MLLNFFSFFENGFIPFGGHQRLRLYLDHLRKRLRLHWVNKDVSHEINSFLFWTAIRSICVLQSQDIRHLSLLNVSHLSFLFTVWASLDSSWSSSYMALKRIIVFGDTVKLERRPLVCFILIEGGFLLTQLIGAVRRASKI